jgi:probable F420-dependent oxidoreductase
MKIGLLAFVTAETIHPGELAKKCESLGFDLLVFAEHPVIPVTHRVPFPRGDGRIPDYYSHTVDPFVALTLAAAATTKIRIGTGICLVPEREPIVTAKLVASVDQYSGGRFVFGIGAGWLADESEVMGVEFRRRWPMTREYVRAMKELWTTPESSFQGKFVSFPPVRCFPKPRQKPHPPVWIGAAGERAIKNTVAIGDGWMPLQPKPEQLKADLAKLRKLCSESGRRFEELEISITMHGTSAPDARDLAKRYEDEGVVRLILNSAPIAGATADRELESMVREWMA